MAKQPKPPSVREDEFYIEIDVQRGEWPFLKALWGSDNEGRTRLVFICDANPRGNVVGENANVGIVPLSKKKAKRLADFIYRSIDRVPD